MVHDEYHHCHALLLIGMLGLNLEAIQLNASCQPILTLHRFTDLMVSAPNSRVAGLSGEADWVLATTLSSRNSSTVIVPVADLLATAQ